MYKSAKVVMLPTEKAVWPNCIWLGRISGNLRIDRSYNELIVKDRVDDSMLPQHLYIISHDKIKEGDWCINNNKDTLYQVSNGDTTNWSKVIATTNMHLRKLVGSDDISHMGIYNYLPQPSKSFIDRYVEDYNKGNIITDIIVEYIKDKARVYKLDRDLIYETISIIV